MLDDTRGAFVQVNNSREANTRRASRSWSDPLRVVLGRASERHLTHAAGRAGGAGALTRNQRLRDGAWNKADMRACGTQNCDSISE